MDAASFYYTVLSSSWYSGSPASNVIITVIDVTSDRMKHLSEEQTLNGSLMNCLEFISSVLESEWSGDQLDLDLMALQLLRCLEFASSIEECVQISRLLTSILNRWGDLEHADDEVLQLMTDCVISLERAHEV